jgi:hypothetical protein
MDWLERMKVSDGIFHVENDLKPFDSKDFLKDISHLFIILGVIIAILSFFPNLLNSFFGIDWKQDNILSYGIVIFITTCYLFIIYIFHIIFIELLKYENTRSKICFTIIQFSIAVSLVLLFTTILLHQNIFISSSITIIVGIIGISFYIYSNIMMLKNWVGE